MKKVILGILLLFSIAVGCENVQETPDGRRYVTKETCIKSHKEKETGYHFGYNFIKGKFGMHFPYECLYTCERTVCDVSTIDTIWKPKKK